MDVNEPPRKATYIGSFPVTLGNPRDRAQFIAKQLDSINRDPATKTTGTSVVISMALCGIKVSSLNAQETYMVHALRRVSFSTCLSELFAFAARDPGQPLNRQYCHVFRTPSADILNSVIGGAFQSAYTIRKGSSTEAPPADERSSSRMSELSTMSTASCAFPNQTRAIPLTSTLDSGAEPVSTSSADDCFEPCYLESVEDTFCNFRHDYDPSSNTNRTAASGPGSSSIGTSSDRSNTRPMADYKSPSTTVRSKTSAHSDDSAISSLADDLERRVILEIEKNAKDDVVSSKSNNRRSSTGPRRSLRSLVRRTAQNNDSGIPSSTASFAQSAKSSAQLGQTHSTTNTGHKQGPFGIKHETATIKKSTSHFENFANFVKTNPVARKLRLLAPGDSYHDLDSRLRVAKWYHQGLPKDIGISVLCQSSLGTFLVLNNSALLVRGIEHVHEYQLVKESKIGWYIKGSSRAFPHLLMLVAHYQTHRDILPLLLDSAPIPAS
ncbi:Oidioi.mRNA.OKI2018_I69.chr1.g1929.t1.cds [Oikopleura dioica]|uniref:Oidioi.mRNA.OKI2018_I69.chr1.g1929.t1.cds n=1 Tax=Oikopleura dioica TaxID=34765 RepID=A0ABN7SR56_OIKDI|nr:Oidioi.mRNA.OKI2018_I69.chr1.g1929.t1.cds [Oikopleura dioica]